MVAIVALGAAGLAAPTVAAHGGSLGASARESVTVPTWLFLLTGGAVVGASFLLASFVTDRRLVEEIHGWRASLPFPGRRTLASIARVGGVLGVACVVAIGYVGPQNGLSNLAILVVWVGWWAGYTMSAYLLGETWSTVNPWRTLAEVLPSLDRSLPSVGAWPAVVGLLTLIWIEVVSPLADDPALLSTVVVGYSVVTLAGAIVYGPDHWFDRVDPIAAVFSYYGHVAPVVTAKSGDARRDSEHPEDANSVALRLPGVGLTRADLVTDSSEVAFVVALLWSTTYDGFVATPAWESLIAPLVEMGVPAHLIYPSALAAGFVVFLGVYRLAARVARSTGETYLAADALARRFAPPLIAIAAGYHLAHYLAYFLSLAPVLATVLPSPLSPPAVVPVYSLPGWFGAIPVASVLAGHLLAIWIAHAAAFDLFPGRLQAIRSQYPVTLVMVAYTMTSLWIVTQPTVQPPFL
ncbi:hypothetical protein HLRTI_000079 [Halorhabdus tiamatea SARL4B]|uniref:Conserved hypothetical membrane protein n=1 Tax=Halorhabdus tiamatea SARL4B TaxID=1033806 RepID=F7PN04_9EURY|nr:hypothetical protein HLRTI_000079 [Halorhabdus tiamatea SARL4B]CCQ32632.1 conserved hypothetical membrane protein [Halorhabdus tiamatea SARL4B]